MTEFFIIIDNTNTNHILTNQELAHLKQTFKVSYLECTDSFDLTNRLTKYAEFYTSENPARLVIYGNQQTMNLANQILTPEHIPFGYLWAHQSFTENLKELAKMAEQTDYNEQTLLYFHEQITDTEGLCNQIKFGKKAQLLKLQQQLHLFNWKHPGQSLLRCLQTAPKYYRTYTIDLYTKGKFINFEHIVSGMIKTTDKQLDLQLAKNLYQDQLLLYVPKRYRYHIIENKLRILVNQPLRIALDGQLSKKQPLDLLIEPKTILTWNAK